MLFSYVTKCFVTVWSLCSWIGCILKAWCPTHGWDPAGSKSNNRHSFITFHEQCPALPCLGNSWIISESGYRVWWFSLKLLHIHEVTCRALLFTTRAFSQSWLPCYIWIMKISPDPLSWMHGSIVNMLLNYLLNMKLSALFLQIPNEKEDSYI